jgi:excisionase family DNA binding protein
MTRAERVAALPASLAPRGLNRVEASAYVGVSPTTFDRMVADGRMPRPKRVGERRVWDRTALDQSFAALPTENDDGEAVSVSDQWAAT